MRFFTPLGFLALLAVPIILLMYLLKQKFKEKEIPSLFLWKRALAQSKSQEPWQKLRKNILMFLQIAAAILLAVSLAGPYYMGQSQVTDYILVLDCSMSMQAQDVGDGTRFEMAQGDMLKLVEQAPPGASFSLITADQAPEIVLSGASEKQTVLKAIRQAQVTNGSVDWQNVSVLVEGQQDAIGGEVALYSDDYNQLSALSVSENIYNGAGDNVAASLLTYTATENGYHALAKVKNYAQTEQVRSVNLYVDSVAFDTVQLQLGGREEADVVFSNVPMDAQELSVRLFPEDVLPVDDEQFVGIASGTTKKALLITEQNVFLEKALSLMDQVEVYKTSPQKASELSGYSLYIFDGWLPEALPVDGYSLLFNPPSGGLLPIGAKETVSQTVRTTDNGDLADISDISFELATATPLRLSWGKTLLRTEDKAVAVYGELDGRKVAVFGFDIHESDLPLTAGFPVLLYRLMEWYFPETAAGVAGVTAEESASFALQPETQKAWVITPSGQKITVAPPFPIQPFLETAETGIYTLVETYATEGMTETNFGVNPATRAESDLTIKQIEGEQAEIESKTVVAGKSLRNLLLLLVCALLMIEWRVNCRES